MVEYYLEYIPHWSKLAKVIFGFIAKKKCEWSETKKNTIKFNICLAYACIPIPLVLI